MSQVLTFVCLQVGLHTGLQIPTLRSCTLISSLAEDHTWGKALRCALCLQRTTRGEWYSGVHWVFREPHMGDGTLVCTVVCTQYSFYPLYQAGHDMGNWFVGSFKGLVWEWPTRHEKLSVSFRRSP